MSSGPDSKFMLDQLEILRISIPDTYGKKLSVNEPNRPQFRSFMSEMYCIKVPDNSAI